MDVLDLNGDNWIEIWWQNWILRMAIFGLRPHPWIRNSPMKIKDQYDLGSFTSHSDWLTGIVTGKTYLLPLSVSFWEYRVTKGLWWLTTTKFVPRRRQFTIQPLVLRGGGGKGRRKGEEERVGRYGVVNKEDRRKRKRRKGQGGERKLLYKINGMF